MVNQYNPTKVDLHTGAAQSGGDGEKEGIEEWLRNDTSPSGIHLFFQCNTSPSIFTFFKSSTSCLIAVSVT